MSHREAFFRQRIPGSICMVEKSVDIYILATNTNGDRKIMYSSRFTFRISKWNQFSRYR